MQFSLEMDFNPKILVVDDEPANLVLMEEALKTLGEVDTCQSAEQALKCIQQHEYHVIILDIEMPIMNGIELCTQIKSDPKTHSCSVIFVTSHNNPEMEYKALSCGGIDFLSKPIDFRLCQTRIKNHILVKKQEFLLDVARRDVNDIIGQAPNFISFWTTDLRCVFYNDEQNLWFNRDITDYSGLAISELLPEVLVNAVKENLPSDEISVHFPVDISSEKLNKKHIQVSISQRIQRHEVSGYLITFTDITRLKEAERNLALERERLHVTLNSIGDAVIATDEFEKVTFMNPIAERLTGWFFHDAEGLPINEVMLLSDATTGTIGFNPITIALQEKRIVGMALNSQLTSQNGQVFRVEDSAAPIKDTNGDIIGAIIVFRDISEAVAMSVKMSHLANYDQLTNLPNRVLLHDRIEQSFRAALHSNRSIALFLIDVDNFKYLNDKLGHHTGDIIIKQIARRLESLVDPNATLSRIGGDEFVVLIPHIRSSGKADSVAMNIVSTLSHPFMINDIDYNITVSIGVSLGPKDANSPEQLITQADAAMFRAKDNGRNQYCFYSDEIEQRLTKRHKLEKLIREAVANNKVEVFYQPKVNLNTGDIVGAEALVRLRGDNGELLSPASFIPLAEETGLINELGNEVLKQSCQDAKRWNELGYPIKVAVNVAAKQFSNDGFYDFVAETIESSCLQSRYLELEVTESALMHDYDKIQALLSDLSQLGLSIAIDDFGTGYSSLSYLKMFPVDVLKIDQSFVNDMLEDNQSLDIVIAVIQLAQSLNLQIVGEGIELKEQGEKLIELGCEVGQGYFYSKPLSKDEFERLLLG